MSQLLTINLSKSPAASWGFRLQGGKDFAQPLCIQKVNVGSVAEAAGIVAGDAIVSIAGNDALSLRHKEAQDAIVRAGNSFQMVLQRGAMTWKPQVTALQQPKKTADGPVATQTSLAVQKTAAMRAPKGFNAVPTGFGELNGLPIVNPQYNTPINLYSEDNIAETLSAQSEVLGKGCMGVNFKKNDRQIEDSAVFKMVQEMDKAPKTPPVVVEGTSSAYSAPLTPSEMIGTPEVPAQGASFRILERFLTLEEKGGAGSGASSPLPSAGAHSPLPSSGAYSPLPSSGGVRSVQAPITKPRQEGKVPGGATLCSQCDRPIIGVFVRIKDKNLHAECFKCNTCGSSLKNVGYYNINDKMYCDVHAKQAAKHNPPAPNMVPVTVKPGAAPPAGAMPASIIKPPAPVPVPEEVLTPTAELPSSVPQEIEAPAPEAPPAPVEQPAPAFVPAPAVAAGGSSANPAAFGAPSGGFDVRSHIPKKDPAPAQSPFSSKPAAAPAPAPSFLAPKPAAAPAPAPSFITPKPAAAPAPAPSFITPKPAAAPSISAPKSAPAPAPSLSAPKPSAGPTSMFGGGSMPKPAPPPGMGGFNKSPGGVKGMTGERIAPKRGRGVMSPAHASRIPLCAACHMQIRGPFITALGKNWCPDCFHCSTDCCRKPLIDIGFVEEQGKLYCEDCYEKYLAPTCSKCGKRIKGDCLNAIGKQFHPECFCCAYCGKIFGSEPFYLEDGLPYCEADWNDLFTVKCVSCGFPIEAGDRWVEALNNNYHSQCFKCTKCQKNLEGQSFFAKGGKPFCKSHAQRGL